MKIKKYDIWLVNLEPIKWSEQAWTRPCVVIQNNIFFNFQNTTIILPITSSKKENWKFKIKLENNLDYWLQKESMILTFQLRTVDKSRFIKKIWEINDLKTKENIKNSLKITLDIDDEFMD